MANYFELMLDLLPRFDGGDMANHLYYGNNLPILRGKIAPESIDLIYLDPPFNSNATYNVLFRAPSGEDSRAQIEAFEDTWKWSLEAEHAFDEVMQGGNTDAADMLKATRDFLGCRLSTPRRCSRRRRAS